MTFTHVSVVLHRGLERVSSQVHLMYRAHVITCITWILH